MAVRSWLQPYFGSSTRGTRRLRRGGQRADTKRLRYQPFFEALESRELLSTVSQTFHGSGAQFNGNQAINTFLGGSFDASGSFGSISHVDLVGDFGATANMSINGRAGLDLTFSGARGTVDVTHDATLTQNFSEPNRFGEFVSFSPANTYVSQNSGSFSTTSPSFGYGASYDIGLHGTIGDVLSGGAGLD